MPFSGDILLFPGNCPKNPGMRGKRRGRPRKTDVARREWPKLVESVPGLDQAFDEFLAAVDDAGKAVYSNPMTQLGGAVPAFAADKVSDLRVGAMGGRNPIQCAKRMVTGLDRGFAGLDEDWLLQPSVATSAAALAVLLRSYVEKHPARAAEWREKQRAGLPLDSFEEEPVTGEDEPASGKLPASQARFTATEPANTTDNAPRTGPRSPQLAQIQATLDGGGNSGSVDTPTLMVRLYFGDTEVDEDHLAYRLNLGRCTIQCALNAARCTTDPMPVEFTLQGKQVRFDGYGFDNSPQWKRAVPPRDSVLKGSTDWQQLCQIENIENDITVTLLADMHDFRIRQEDLPARPSVADRLKQNFFRRAALGAPDAAGQYTLDVKQVPARGIARDA